MIHSPIKEQALALRLGILSGYATVQDAVAWADGIISADLLDEAPQALNLSLLPSSNWADAITLLGQVPGDAVSQDVGRDCARLMQCRIESGTLDVQTAARAMFRLEIEGFSPDAEFTGMAYYLDDAFDLASSGTWGTLDDVERELRSFLKRYESATQS
jgi:hypothetical protein